MIKMKEKAKNEIIIKFFQLLFILLMSLFFPNKINAATDKISIICDDGEIKPNEVLKCHIKGENFSYSVSSIHSELKISNNTPITSIKKDSIWEGAVDNGIIDLYTDTNKSGNFNILDFEFKIPSTVNQITITLNSITLSDASFNSIPFSEISKSIVIKEESSNNNNNENNDDNQNNNNNNENNNNQNNSNNNNSNNNDNVINNPNTGTSYIVFGIIGGLISFVMLLILKRGQNNE